MTTYNARNATVEAMRFGSVRDYLLIVKWMKERGDTTALADEVRFTSPVMLLPSGGGMQVAHFGDFIVRDQFGNFFPVKGDVFTAMYAEAGA